MDKKTRKLLYRSFDEELKPKHKEQLETALKSSPELRKEKEEIASQRQALKDNAAQSFQPFFADRVVNRLFFGKTAENGWEAFYQTFKALFGRFAIACGIIGLILFTYNVTIGDSLDPEEVFFVSDIAIEELYKLPLF